MFKLKSFKWTAERFLYASTRDFLNANSVMSGRKEKDEIAALLSHSFTTLAIVDVKYFGDKR
jgi:hypothetical protein